MAAIRENFWIPKLRQIPKRVIRICFECKKFHTLLFITQQQGILPLDRTTETRSFQVIGTHFADAIMYHNKNRSEKKAYILLFTCSLTRAIHLELLLDQTTDGFIRVLKKLIARKGCLETIYSNSAKIYVAVSKWIKKINKSKILDHLLSTRSIKLKFDLFWAPWLHEEVERMVGLVKNTLYKTVWGVKVRVERIRRSSHRYRDNVKQ